jgi:hypothetical protein
MVKRLDFLDTCWSLSITVCVFLSDGPSSPDGLDPQGQFPGFPGFSSPIPPGYANFCLRPGMAGMYHNGLSFHPATTFPGASPGYPTPPVASGYPASHLPPFYLYAHAQKALLQQQQQQHGSLGSAEGVRSAPCATSVRADMPTDEAKETILSNSIENLRMRARQHAASLGFTD